MPPFSCLPPVGASGGSWSVQARILPYMEQSNLLTLIDFRYNYSDITNVPSHAKVTEARVPSFICASEVRAEPRPPASGVGATHFPLSYAANLGPWYVFDPKMSRMSDGAFVINGKLTTGAYQDGFSNTLAFSEVKAYQPNLKPGVPAGANDPIPATPAAVQAFLSGTVSMTGHTEWVDGKVHETGFTAALAPNTKVSFTADGVVHDVNLISKAENAANTVPTYAAVTSRSYHPGVVQAALMDGSVRTISSNIAVDIWRAMSTRAARDAFQMP
jgi:hypothetical protein